MKTSNCPFCGNRDLTEIFDHNEPGESRKIHLCRPCQITWPVDKHAEIREMRRKAEAWNRMWEFHSAAGNPRMRKELLFMESIYAQANAEEQS